MNKKFCILVHTVLCSVLSVLGKYINRITYKMATALVRCIIFIVFFMCVSADEIELEATSGVVLKMLREMANQTSADTLNLPANATSIRENITDTFSCENRVYGYYADVDNECQIFHVCLPSQTQSGRNVTYRWSFICPAETVFNQEVLVCTRPIDSIPCEDSPAYYDVNNEIGKIAESKEDSQPTNEVETNTNKNGLKETENVTVKNQKRFPSRKKQNMVEKLIDKAVEEMNKMEDEVIDEGGNIDNFGSDDTSNGAKIEMTQPDEPVEMKQEMTDMEATFEGSRLGTERSLRTGRHGWRGSYRYRSNQY